MTLVVANQKGGVGKSTIATNLAAAFSTSHETLLIDHDTSHVSLNFFNRRKYHEALSPFHAVAPKDYDDMLELLELNRKMTIVDLGGFTDDLAKAALVFADIILVPTSTSTQDMDGNIHFMQTITKLKETGVEAKVLYVANNTDPRMKAPRIAQELDYITDAGYEIISTVPHYRVFSESHGAGHGVIEYAPKSKAATAIRNLIDKLIQEMQDG